MTSSPEFGRLEPSRRAHQADPEDVNAQIRALKARARVEGPSVFAEFLNNIGLWSQQPEPVQDLILGAIAESLKGHYEFLETRRFQNPAPTLPSFEEPRIACFRHRRSGLIVHLLPGGDFDIPDDEPLIYNTQKRPLTAQAMLMGRVPVAIGEWQSLNADAKAAQSGSWPMNNVSWDEAQDWCLRAGGGLALPSIKEWEYAYRAGSWSSFYWGSELDGRYCWSLENSDGRSHDLRIHWQSESWNGFGLVDMSGQVWEWVQDSYYPEELLPPDDPSRHIRVMRGGSWKTSADTCRAHFNGTGDRDGRYEHVGFRVCRRLDDILQ